jgi:transposase-like protein
MSLDQLYLIFPDRQACIGHLEKMRWKSIPTCPYCRSIKQSPMKDSKRYHCNTCNTSYSVMIGSIFENTKLDFQKWVYTISLVINSKKRISSRQLAKEIGVTKDTAWYMIERIKKGKIEYREILDGIVLENKI